MTRMTAWTTTILFCILAVVLAGCGKGNQDTVRIGVSLPLTGDAAVWGKSQQDGYELACEQINAKGGINGKKIQLVYGDDTGLPKDGVSVLRKLIDVDRIEVLTGVANSSVALAFIPIIDKEKILFMSSGASSPKLTGASKYFFRTWPSDIAEALAMAKYAYGEMKIRTVAVLYINNDYGIGLLEPFKKTYESLGGKVLSAESFEQNATDFRAQLTKLQALNADAIYLAGNPREMARAITQARELGIKSQILSISVLNDKEVFDILKPGDIEGTVITDASLDRESDDPAVKKFLADFRTKFNREPGLMANTAYDALTILAQGIAQVGTDADSLSSFLYGLRDYTAVSGDMSFTKGGDVQRPIRIAVCRNAHFDVLLRDFRWYEVKE
ncbi:MAG: penicillin-binding protein activator [Candidatus Hydrogenedentes bacterium]|nr:penicillin-binding protein activator [Candidatus Hydrogenedentota bacterium]